MSFFSVLLCIFYFFFFFLLYLYINLTFLFIFNNFFFFSFFFFFNDTATTEIYTLSLHDALPICPYISTRGAWRCAWPHRRSCPDPAPRRSPRSRLRARCPRSRSEEHTSELQ